MICSGDIYIFIINCLKIFSKEGIWRGLRLSGFIWPVSLCPTHTAVETHASAASAGGYVSAMHWDIRFNKRISDLLSRERVLCWASCEEQPCCVPSGQDGIESLSLIWAKDQTNSQPPSLPGERTQRLGLRAKWNYSCADVDILE